MEEPPVTAWPKGPLREPDRGKPRPESPDRKAQTGKSRPGKAQTGKPRPESPDRKAQTGKPRPEGPVHNVQPGMPEDRALGSRKTQPGRRIDETQISWRHRHVGQRHVPRHDDVRQMGQL